MTIPAYPQSSLWPARLLTLAAGGMIVLTCAHPSSTRQFTWPWILGLTALWLAPLLALGGVAKLRLPTGFALRAGLGLLALATLVSAALSPFPVPSLLRIWPTLGGIALFLWLHHWLGAPGRTHRAARLAQGLAGCGAALAVYSLIRWHGHSVGDWTVRNDVPFGHSNYTAGALLLILPWLALAAWRATGLRRLAWMIAAFAGMTVLLTTSSRAGVLALAATTGLATLLGCWRAPWPRRTKLALALGALLLVALAVLANPRLRELVAGGGWSDVARESNTQRSAMVAAGIALGAERPLLGWGPGTVPLTYPLVRARLAGGVDNVLQLHNTPAQVWATLGATGLLALLLLLAATLHRLRAVLRTPEPLALTAGATLLAYGLFALTDHQLDLPALNALLTLNLALLFHGPGPAPAVNFSRWPKFILATALAVPLALTGRDLWARHAYTQALDAFAANDTATALTQLEQAAQRAPYDPYYRHQLAGALLAQRGMAPDATARASLDSAAAEQLRLSLAAGSFQEFAHFNLAWLALDAGAPRLAVDHFRATLALAPHRGGAYFGLGLALRDAGQPAAAVRAFALEWINDPAAATAPVWELPDFAPYRIGVAREAAAILDELAATRPAATYVGALWRWWETGGALPAQGFNHESDLFVTTLAALQNQQPPPAAAAAYPWGALFAAWRDHPGDFSALAPRDPALAAALAARAARHPAPAVHGFLTASSDDASFLVTTRPARTGYGVLALHPDGPVPTDLYVRQSPRLVSGFASGLFPPKGWVPAQVLLSRLPASSPPP